MLSGGFAACSRSGLDLRLGLAVLLSAAVALLIVALAPAGAHAKSDGAFATVSKVDQVRVRCAHTGPWKGLVRVDAEVRHADVRREKRFRDRHLIVRAKVKLRKDNGTRLATMSGRGKLRAAVKGKTTAHRYHDYLGQGESNRVLRYARGNGRCAKKPGQRQSLTVDTRISQRLSGGGGASALASGGSSSRSQSVSDTRARNVLGADPPLFRAPIETPGGGTTPLDVATAHFTKHPILDVVMPNSASSDVSVLLGTGAGTFAPAPGAPIAVDGNPGSAAVSDLNGDGKEDLAAGTAKGATILLGAGSGTFDPAPDSPFAAGQDPSSVAVGRFTSLAKNDLAVANRGSNNVSILLGTGTGSFGPGPGSPVGAGDAPESAAVADVNGDGKDDFVVANRGSNDVSVLLGTGQGTFNPAPGSPFPAGALPSSGTPGGPVSVAVGDLNGDQHEDLAVANQGDPILPRVAGNVSILLGDGKGSFNPAPDSPIGGFDSPASVAVADLNGDRKDDLAVTDAGYEFGPDPGGETVSVLLGDGKGKFDPAPGSPFSVDDPESVTVGDVNGDQRDDLAVISGNDVAVLLNNG